MYGQLAGKLLPYLVKAGSAARLPTVLRTAGGLAGAAPGLMQGDLGKAVLGGGLGAASTLGMGGALGGLGQRGAGLTANLIGRAGLGGNLASNMAAQQFGSALANVALPAAGGYALGGLGSGMLGGPVAGGAERAVGMGMGMGQTSNTNLPGNPQNVRISPEHIRMGRGPDGGVFYEIDPRGLKAGLRIGSGLDTQQNISNMNDYYNAQLPQWDEIERRKQGRAIQNAQISSNIALARQLSGNRQIADLEIAKNQAAAMGNMFANTSVPTLAM